MAILAADHTSKQQVGKNIRCPSALLIIVPILELGRVRLADRRRLAAIGKVGQREGRSGGESLRESSWQDQNGHFLEHNFMKT